MKLRVSVLGAGSFGTTMAHLLSHNAPTLLWCRRPETADEINQIHRNEAYLPDYDVSTAVRATAIAPCAGFPAKSSPTRSASLLIPMLQTVSTPSISASIVKPTPARSRCR